jgi:hypothetical protein
VQSANDDKREAIMRFARAARPGAFLIFLLAIAGCGESTITSEVKGTVSVDGVPVTNGAINFLPADGMTKTTGGKIKDGKYLVQVPIGEMKVAIYAPVFSHKQKLYDTPDSRERDVFIESLPEKYNRETELQLDVKPGGMEKDFELTTK